MKHKLVTMEELIENMLQYALEPSNDPPTHCKHVFEHDNTQCMNPPNSSGYCYHHEISTCKGTFKNGKKCKYRPVYMGFCRIHGKHIMAEEEDPYVLIQTGNYQLFKDRVVNNKLDVNYVKDGKTVLHRLLTDKDIKDAHKYSTILAQNGLDINKCSIDRFADMEGNIHYNTAISPIIYLLNVPRVYKANKGDIVMRKLFTGIRDNFNFDQYFNGVHLLERALNHGYFGFIQQACLYAPDNVLQNFRDQNGRSIISSYIYRYQYNLYWSKNKLGFLKKLLENRVLANIKDETGCIPAMGVIKMFAGRSYIINVRNIYGTYEEFLGASDFSLTHRNISILETEEYKKLGLRDVYSYIDQIKLYTWIEHGANERSMYRNAIQSLLDIIFTMKMIVKRREKGLCNLTGNKIIDHLLSLYV